MSKIKGKFVCHVVKNTLHCINVLTTLFKVDTLNVSFYPYNIFNKSKLTTKIPSLQTKVQLDVSWGHNYIFVHKNKV